VYFKQFYLGCLAHASYLIGSRGEAVVVDPQRDVEQYLAEAEANGLTIKHIIETHLHADFVSGHLELAARTGAHVYLGRRANAAFDHVPVTDGDEVLVGDSVLRFLETPGHTPEGVSVLVFDRSVSPEPLKLLSGDTLFIGDVGRPDLVAARGYTAEDMAGMLHDSLQTKIQPLPDSVEVYPAHGAGSACGRFMSNERSSTLGDQRRTNWALQPMDRETFVQSLLNGLATPPSYFSYDAELNRRGPAVLREIAQLPALEPEKVSEAQAGGAMVLDVRASDEYGRGHVPGSINIGLGGSFASWAGTLVPIGTPILLVGKNPAQAEEAMIRLARVGHDSLAGYLVGGIDAWAEAGLPVGTLRQMTVRELYQLYADGEPLQIVDVRETAEHESGHAPGTRHIPLGQLDERASELRPNKRTYLICGSGYRSSPAAGVLRRNGFTDVVNIIGGHGAWQQAGLPMVQQSLV
jgi:hydroxyacylglutathione hydrolase